MGIAICAVFGFDEYNVRREHLILSVYCDFEAFYDHIKICNGSRYYSTHYRPNCPIEFVHSDHMLLGGAEDLLRIENIILIKVKTDLRTKCTSKLSDSNHESGPKVCLQMASRAGGVMENQLVDETNTEDGEISGYRQEMLEEGPEKEFLEGNQVLDLIVDLCEKVNGDSSRNVEGDILQQDEKSYNLEQESIGERKKQHLQEESEKPLLLTLLMSTFSFLVLAPESVFEASLRLSAATARPCWVV
ncbi:hypothetical protein Q3G72_014273 [Acer saccharum]|nr:hypothetical protein Q3G72_014273 [Acer saccharum]